MMLNSQTTEAYSKAKISNKDSNNKISNKTAQNIKQKKGEQRSRASHMMGL